MKSKPIQAIEACPSNKNDRNYMCAHACVCGGDQIHLLGRAANTAADTRTRDKDLKEHLTHTIELPYHKLLATIGIAQEAWTCAVRKKNSVTRRTV